MGKRICVWGDSIVVGHVDDMGGWVDRLKRYFWSDNNLSENSVYNLGISGNTTEEMVSRLEVECSSRRPGIIIFAVGVNDSAWLGKNHWVEESDFKKNLKSIIEISRNFTSEIVFIGLTMVDESLTNPVPWNRSVCHKNKDVKKYNKILKDFCKNEDVLFLDMKGVVSKNDLYDGLHPNSEGHRKMFKKVKDFLIEEGLIDKIDEQKI